MSDRINQLRQAAEHLGLFYNGPQLGRRHEVLFFVVTDLRLGSFSVKPGADLRQAYREFLARFAASDGATTCMAPKSR